MQGPTNPFPLTCSVIYKLALQKLHSARPKVKRRSPSLAAEFQSKEDGRDLLLYKDFFHKLQNLEKFPEVLPRARDLLITFFAETIEIAQHAAEPGILTLDEYSPEALIEFLTLSIDQERINSTPVNDLISVSNHP